jgi:hypothetical protein
MVDETKIAKASATLGSKAMPEPAPCGTGVVIYGNWGKLVCDRETGNVLSYDRTDSDSECDTDDYHNVVKVDLGGYRVRYGSVPTIIDIVFVGYWTSTGYEAPIEHRMPETFAERLKRLYPKHYVRILELMDKDHGPDATARMLSRTATGCELSRAFLWGSTHEGYKFWKALMEQSNG